MAEEVNDSASWTGLSDEAPISSREVPTTQQRSKRLRIILAVSVGVGGSVAVGLNNFYLERRIEPAEVSWVRFIPAHYAGKSWVEEKWDVHISLKREDSDIILDQAPPEW